MAPEPLNVNNPPDLMPDMPDAGDWMARAGSWVQHNAWWLVLLAFLSLVAVLVYLWLSRAIETRRLERNALQVLHKDARLGAKAYRLGRKGLRATGSAQVPPARLGRLRGFIKDVEAWVFVYRRGPFTPERVLIVNPKDVTSGLDSREVHLSIVSVRAHRGFLLGVPDVHDAGERAKWSAALRVPIPDATAFAEAWKGYMYRAVDSLLHFDGSLLSLQSEHYLGEVVTYSSWEQGPEVVEVPAERPTKADAVGGAEPAR